MTPFSQTLRAYLKTYAVVIASGAKQSLLPLINDPRIALPPAAPRSDSGRSACRRPLHAQGRKVLFAGVALSVLLTPPWALAAERDGMVLFFSFEELKQMLSHPSHPSLPQVFPGFSWRDQREQTGQQSPIERNYQWGNGRGFNGSTRPGTRPLWGY